MESASVTSSVDVANDKHDESLLKNENTLEIDSETPNNGVQEHNTEHNTTSVEETDAHNDAVASNGGKVSSGENEAVEKAESPSLKIEDSEQPRLKKAKLDNSREVSVEGDQAAPIVSDAPIHEIVGGSSVRQYLNKHLTKQLLQGLKEVAQKKPLDPLLYLGEYLIAKSKEEQLAE